MAKKRKAASPLQPSSLSPPDSAHAWIVKLRAENERLRQELSRLTERIDGIETEQDAINQRNRLVSLIFSGPAIPEPVHREETAGIVQHLVDRFMNRNLDMSQVSNAFRLRAGCILVQFASAAKGSERDNLFRSKGRLRGTGLFISESLTPRRQELLRSLLQLKKENQIHSAYSQSGELFIRKSSDSRPINIADWAALHRLTSDVARQPERGPVRSRDHCSGQTTGAAAASGHAAPADWDLAPPVGRPLRSPQTQRTCQPAAAGGSGRRRVTREAECQRTPAAPEPYLSAPLRLAGLESAAPPSGRTDLWHDAATDPAGDASVRGATAARMDADPCGNSESTAAVSAVTPVSPRKMKVSVAGRVRVITISNQSDVIETVTDLVKAWKHMPQKYRKDIASFWSELKKRANSIENEVKTGGEAVLKYGEAVKRARDATRLLLEASRYPDEDPSD